MDIRRHRDTGLSQGRLDHVGSVLMTPVLFKLAHLGQILSLLRSLGRRIDDGKSNLEAGGTRYTGDRLGLERQGVQHGLALGDVGKKRFAGQMLVQIKDEHHGRNNQKNGIVGSHNKPP